MKYKYSLLIAAFAIFSIADAAAQVSMKALPHPDIMSTVTQQIGFADVSVVYSNPSAERRRVFGQMRPYNRLWPEGAEFVTILLTNDTINIKNVIVPPGEYSMFGIPKGEDMVEMVINKDSKFAGEYGYLKSKDVGRFSTKAVKTDYYNDDFDVKFRNVRGDAAEVIMGWKNSSVKFDITTDTYNRVLSNLSKTDAKAKEYYEAAKYFYQSTETTSHAIALLDRSLSIEKTTDALYMKALLLAESREYKAAVQAGEEAKKYASKSGDKELEKLINDSLGQWAKEKSVDTGTGKGRQR